MNPTAIKQRLNDLGITQSQLARGVRISDKYMSDLLCERHPLTIQLQAQIENVFAMFELPEPAAPPDEKPRDMPITIRKTFSAEKKIIPAQYVVIDKAYLRERQPETHDEILAQDKRIKAAQAYLRNGKSKLLKTPVVIGVKGKRCYFLADGFETVQAYQRSDTQNIEVWAYTVEAHDLEYVKAA